MKTYAADRPKRPDRVGRSTDASRALITTSPLYKHLVHIKIQFVSSDKRYTTFLRHSLRLLQDYQIKQKAEPRGFINSLCYKLYSTFLLDKM